MRTLLLSLSMLAVHYALGQCCTADSIYLMLDTSEVKWDSRSVPCISERVELKWAYVFQNTEDHHEFARLSHRLMKSQRRYSRSLWCFYFKQESRRMARWEKFMIDHSVGKLDLTDGGILVLKEASRPTRTFSYRLFAEEHRYSLITIDPLLLTMLGGATYRLAPLN